MLILLLTTSSINLLEISTRPWLYELSLKYGKKITKLKDIPSNELDNINEMGFDWVWFMGLWELGPYGLNHDKTDPNLKSSYDKVLPGWTIDDVIGSPYAIVNYTLNTELGNILDVSWLKNELNKRNIKLMVDFVPNHSAVDCPWTNKSIEYYVRAPKGSKPPYDPKRYLPNGIAYGGSQYDAWTDTAQLNYWDLGLRKARIQQLLSIASVSDGIRCDMAMLVLNNDIQTNWNTQLSSWGYSKPNTEFWKDAITTVKNKYPSFIFLGEAYWELEQLYNCGFDFLYNKGLLDKLKTFDLSQIWSQIESGGFNKYANFIENHDEPRAAEVFGDYIKADGAALVTYTLPGMKFTFQDQWKGYHNKLDIHLRRALSEPEHKDSETLYKKLLKIISSPVFKIGKWNLIEDCSNKGQLLTWRWNNNEDKRLVIVNFTMYKGSGTVIVSDVIGDGNVQIKELFSDISYSRSAPDMRTKGLYVEVAPWSAQIFTYP